MSDEQNTTGRNPDGTFAPGNPGGPGRPARAVESDFLRRFAVRCTLERFENIAGKVLELAEQGERWAVELVFKHALGSTPLSLVELAALDRLGIDGAAEIQAQVDAERARAKSPFAKKWGEVNTPREQAIENVLLAEVSKAAELVAEERARRRAERQAQKAAQALAEEAGPLNNQE